MAKKAKNTKGKSAKSQSKPTGRQNPIRPPRGFDNLRVDSHEEYENRLKRRAIIKDYNHLIKISPFNDQRVYEFMANYHDSLDLMREALAPYKHSEDLYSKLIWRYLTGGSDDAFDAEVLKSTLINDRGNELNHLLPSPIKIMVNTSEDGPKYEEITSDFLTQTLGMALSGSYDQIKVRGDLSIDSVGEYPITIGFADGIEIAYKIILELNQERLPEELSNSTNLLQAEPLSNTRNILGYLQSKLDEESSSDIANYFPIMSDVLKTAHIYGYWKSAWIRNIHQEWKSRYKEFLLNQEIQEIIERIKEINEDEIWIPEEYDNERLESVAVKKAAEQIINADPVFSKHELIVNINNDNLNIERLEVDISLPSGASLGKVYLQRLSIFLPPSIREELHDADITRFTNLQLARNDGQLFDLADLETKIGIDLVDEGNHPDHQARSQHLAGVCRVLLDKRKVGSLQFKRTLTCYYANRGPELADENPTAARKYFLLFYRMMYKEGMNEHLKAGRPLEYAILSAYLVTYLSNQAQKRYIRTTDIKCPPDLLPQRYLLVRAAQLFNESPTSFMVAIFRMYLIEPSFIRNLLRNLQQRLGKKIERYDLAELLPDAKPLIKYLVTFLHSDLEDFDIEFENSDLVEFIFSIIDCTVIIKPIVSELELLVESSRSFWAAKEPVKKSNLYSSVDRGLLQCNEVVNQLANQLRLFPERMKKASRIAKFLDEVKVYTDNLHREFFKSAKLELQIENVTIPKGRQSPVELSIRNLESGNASRVFIKLDINTSYRAEQYRIPIRPFFANEKRLETIEITPLSDIAVELSGAVFYSDQESLEKPDIISKSALFKQTITVSDPTQFRPFRSPYITGLAINDSGMFFGRRKEMEEIIRYLRGSSQDRVLAIHGERRIGKTSLLFQLKQGKPNILQIEGLGELQQDYSIVYVSFERIQDDDQTWQIYYRVYMGITQSGEFAESQIQEIPIEDFQNNPPDLIFEKFLVKMLNHLLAKKKKLLLMFDEFDNLIRIGGEERGVFGFLRDFIMQHGLEASFIFVGQTITMMKEMSDKTKRLFSLPVPKEILRLSDNEAYELIYNPMKSVEPSFVWSDGAIRKIIHFTDGNPYFIQVLCNQVVQCLISGKRLRVTMNDVEKAIEDTVLDYVGNLKGALSDVLIDAGLNINSKLVLAALASLIIDENFEDQWVSSDAIRHKILEIPSNFGINLLTSLLNDLCYSGILLHQDEQTDDSLFAFRLPLLRLYVGKYLNLRDLLKVGGYL